MPVSVEEEDFVLGQLIQVIRDDIWLLVAVAATIIAVAALYCGLATPIYSADALIRVEQSDTMSQMFMQASELGGMLPLPTEAEIGIIGSRNVVGPVVQSFKLNFSVQPKTVPLLGSLAELFSTPGQPGRPWLGLSSYAWGGEDVDVESVDVMPSLEGQKMTLIARSASEYELFGPGDELLVRGEIGKPAHGGGVTILVNRLIARPGTRFTVVRMNEVDAINAFQAAIQVQEQGKMTGLIGVSLESKDPQRAADMANALAQSYLRQHIASKQISASNMLDFLKGEEPRLKSDLEQAEVELATYRRQSGSIAVSDEAKAYLEGSIQYEQQIAALRLQIASLEERYGDSHPLIQVTRKQMAELEAQRDKYSNRFQDLPATEVKAVQLQRNAKVAGDIYELVLTREQELAVQKAGTGGNVNLVDAALRPGSPIKPKKLLILVAATMLGLITGIGAVFLRRNLFKGIDDPEQIERLFHLPVYGLVPLSAEQAQLEGAAGPNGQSVQGVLAKSNPRDVCVESLRSLRTSMQFTLMDARNRIVMLTGPMPGVGKSFLTVNLAALLANSGKRVLVIDADMRRGALERYFGGSPKDGLSDLLSGQITVEKAIRQSDIENLSFITCGRRPPNPAELLTSPRLQQTLESLASHYDVILIDTPPVLAVADASIVGAHAGTTFFVMRSGAHSQTEIASAIKRLKVAGVHIHGGIFNGMSRQGRYGYPVVQEYLSA